MPKARDARPRLEEPDQSTHSPEPSRRGGSAVLRYTAPSILVAVALVQAFLAHTQDMTPWKGGGFGMFASVDRANHRSVRVFLGTPDGEVPAVFAATEGVSAVPEDTIVRVRNLPTQGALDSLGADLASTEWVYEDKDGTPVAVTRDSEAAAVTAATDEDGTGASATAVAENAEEQGPAVVVESVRIEVWRLNFDPDVLEIVPTKLADVTREIS
jgi:hypothetical protein